MRKRCVRKIKKELPNIKDGQLVFLSAQKKKTRKVELNLYRGSIFRGVSVNGDKWQVFVILNNKKYYVGQMLCEKTAAMLYDMVMMIHFGLITKTNFVYDKYQVDTILKLYLNTIK